MLDTAAFTLAKEERVSSKRLIDELFTGSNSRSMVAFPIRLVYMQVENDHPQAQILVSVSKRYFKKAVKRNRVKRQIREAYRHHKTILTAKVPEDKSIAIAFIWLADELFDSQQVERCVKRLLGKVAESI